MNHHYGDVSNLNAPYDQIVYPVQGVGATSEVPASVRECGSYPWRMYSSCTKKIQVEAINPLLREDGYHTISEDGKLGPATCGAMALYDSAHWAPACLDHESEWVAPTRASGGSSTSPTLQADVIGVGSSGGLPTWAIGLAVGALAIGAAIYMQKKR